MEQRTEPDVSPYRAFSRAEWAKLREITRLRSLHDRLDISEVEEIYLPLSRLLSLYVVGTQRLFRAQQGFLGTEDAKVPDIIGVGGSVADGNSSAARVHAFFAPKTPRCRTLLVLLVRSPSASRPPRACCRRYWRVGRMCPRSVSSPPTVSSTPTP